MYFMQADVLSGLDKAFIGRMMEVGVKSTYDEGTVLFDQGEAARRFYILVKGQVRLSFGENQNSVYTVDHGGEAFGWSSLIGSDHYTAAARCVTPSTLIAFERIDMEALLKSTDRRPPRRWSFSSRHYGRPPSEDGGLSSRLERQKDSSTISVKDLTTLMAINASKISLQHQLPMADSLILATANLDKCILWTRDSDFKNLPMVNFIPKKRVGHPGH